MCQSLYISPTKEHELAAKMWIDLARSRGDPRACERVFDHHPIVDYRFVKEELGLRFGASRDLTLFALKHCGKETPFCIAKAERHISGYDGPIKDFGFSQIEKSVLMVLYQMGVR